MQTQQVILDVLKPTGTIVDLSDSFNARVGDKMTPFQLFILEGGVAKDLKGMHPELEAVVGNGALKGNKAIMNAGAKGVHWVGSTNNVTGYNQLTLAFPAEVFPQSGFCYGHLILANEAGIRESSVDIWFQVLDGTPQMGMVADHYDSELALELAKAKNMNDQFSQEMRVAYNQQVTDAHNALTQATSDLSHLSVSVGAVQAQIDADNIVTENEFNNGLDSARMEMKAIIEKVTSGSPKPIENLATLQSEYPQGADGFYVANDNNHRYAYIDNSWKDLGLYQANGIVDGSVDRAKLSDTFASPYDFLCGIKDNLDNLFSEGNYILSKDSNGNIPSGLPLDADLDKYIYMLENRVAGHEDELYVHQALIRSDGASYERFLSKSGKFNTDWNYVQENGLFIKNVSKQGLREIHLDLTDYKLYNSDGTISDFKNLQNTDPGYPQNAIYKNAQKFPVSSGDIYVIYGYTDSTMLYALTDLNGKVYSSISGQKELYRWFFTVAQDGYLLVNSLYGKTRLWKADGTQAIDGEKLTDESVKMPALQSSIQNSFYAQTEILQAQNNDHGVYKADGSLVYSSDTSSIGKVHVASGESYRITSSEVDGIAIILFDANNQVTRALGARDVIIPAKDEWAMSVNGNNAKIEHVVGYLPKMLLGQNWCALGDSLTSKYTLGEGVPNYVQLVADRTGVTYYQQGHGGGGYLADNNAFQSLFPKDTTDIVTIFGSFNDVYVKDFQAGVPGSTDTSTLWGAVKKVIDNCYSVNSDIRIGLIAPTPWISVNPQQTNVNEAIAEAFDQTGAKAGDNYVQLLKDISDYYSIPFLDLYHNSGFRIYDQAWDNDHTLINDEGKGDGGHPNTRGSKIIANKIARFIESL